MVDRRKSKIITAFNVIIFALTNHKLLATANNMQETINLEQAVLNKLRQLPQEKQQELLDFAEFLVEKTKKITQVPLETSERHKSLKTQLPLKLSIEEIARLPIPERHKILEPFIAATAEDFFTDPQLTEFSVLDGEDWESENDD